MKANSKADSKAPAGRAGRRAPTLAARADRHALYEKSVQNAEAEIDFVDTTFRALRGRRARWLREDFCGTANVCAEWVRRRRDNVAIGVDLDASVLAWGREHHIDPLSPAARKRVRLLEANVLSAKTRHVDVLLAMNFSYWIFKTREQMREYFGTVRRNLVKDGLFVLDCYGGYDAFRVLKEPRKVGRFTYVWEQASYNPLTGDMTCHIHFKFKDGSSLKQAFSYEWRLWTLPEIRELLTEAGFKQVIVYTQGWDEKSGEPNGEFSPAETADPDAGWISYIVAVK
jgi:cyclopropane fatty-acyl-phospholipid synthase-like methyltransferase